jgi:hypothetical protein
MSAGTKNQFSIIKKTPEPRSRPVRPKSELAVVGLSPVATAACSSRSTRRRGGGHHRRSPLPLAALDLPAEGEEVIVEEPTAGSTLSWTLGNESDERGRWTCKIGMESNHINLPGSSPQATSSTHLVLERGKQDGNLRSGAEETADGLFSRGLLLRLGPPRLGLLLQPAWAPCLEPDGEGGGDGTLRSGHVAGRPSRAASIPMPHHH